MKLWPNQIYQLLPAVHQIRDAEQGEPLRQLLGLIGEQVQAVQDDIAGLYDNWFVETADSWVVPYLGDLVGYRRVQDAGPTGDVGRRGQLLNRILFPRREIANLVRRRRRKGTLPVLEAVADDVAAWPARAVEFGNLVTTFQNIKHFRPDFGGTVNINNAQATVRLNTPFDRVPHLMDVRRIQSLPGVGWYHPLKLGLFVWRRQVFSATEVVPRRLCTFRRCKSRHCRHIAAYTFDRVGLFRRLYVNPLKKSGDDAISAEPNLPIPLYRHLLRDPDSGHAAQAYYGSGQNDDASLSISVQWKAGGPFEVLSNAQVEVCRLYSRASLGAAARRLPAESVAVDPERGVFVFSVKKRPCRVRVSYHYAFSMPMGGGSYDRPWTAPTDRTTVRLASAGQQVGAPQGYAPHSLFRLIRRALADSSALQKKTLRSGKRKQKCLVVDQNLCIEIQDNDTYLVPAHKTLWIKDGRTLEIRAATNRWPLVCIGAADSEPDERAWHVRLGHGSRLILDGLQVCGATLMVQQPPRVPPAAGLCDCDPPRQQELTPQSPNEPAPSAPKRAAPSPERPASLVVRHTTFVPGGQTHRPGSKIAGHPSITMRLPGGLLVIDHSITGVLNVEHPRCPGTRESGAEPEACPLPPLKICVADSIIQSTSNKPALMGGCCLPAHADLTVQRTTILGDVCLQQMSQAEDSIFDGMIHVQRRATGYMRFCSVPMAAQPLSVWGNEAAWRCWYHWLLCPLTECPPPVDGDWPPIADVDYCYVFRTPPRFKCVPEPPGPRAAAMGPCQTGCGEPSAPVQIADDLIAPEFVSRRYGDPGYADLSLRSAPEILRGASDESELGAFHDLYRPQRAANLAAVLQEYTPAEVTSQIIFADDLHLALFGCGAGRGPHCPEG